MIEKTRTICEIDGPLALKSRIKQILVFETRFTESRKGLKEGETYSSDRQSLIKEAFAQLYPKSEILIVHVTPHDIIEMYPTTPLPRFLRNGGIIVSLSTSIFDFHKGITEALLSAQKTTKTRIVSIPHDTRPIRYSLTIKKGTNYLDIEYYLRKQNIYAIYLTQKRSDANLVESAGALKQYLPKLDIVITISAKYYKNIQEVVEVIESAQQVGVNKFLIVSGHPKSELDSVTILDSIHTDAELFCAYNPYEPNIEMENNRLLQKLKNPAVKGVFLQIGIEPQKLEKAIEFIWAQNDTLILEGCILQPTKEIRERLQSQPIHGIYLSNEYLEGDFYANKITRRISDIYKKHGINEIVEDFLRNRMKQENRANQNVTRNNVLVGKARAKLLPTISQVLTVGSVQKLQDFSVIF